MAIIKGSVEYLLLVIHLISKKLFKWDFEDIYKNQLLKIRYRIELWFFTFMQDLFRIDIQKDNRDAHNQNVPAVYIPTHAGFLDMILNRRQTN